MVNKPIYPSGWVPLARWQCIVDEIDCGDRIELRSGETKMYKHILIATDGSELADRGVEQGFALAQAVGAKVTVLSVTEPMPERARHAAVIGGVEDPAARYDQSIVNDMKFRFASISARASEKGVSVDLVHEIDMHPAEAIVRLADRENCDLIVMSSHGRRGVRRFVLGSQTAEVVTHTTIPVLVIR